MVAFRKWRMGGGGGGRKMNPEINLGGFDEKFMDAVKLVR